MIKKNNLNFYILIALMVIIADRLTKACALRLTSDRIINEFLSYSLSFNRGINWGFFNSTNPTIFTIINIVIAAVLIALIGYTYFCWKLKQPILGYVLILAGGFSNYFDRIFHGGVIDFIVLSWGNWQWPAFNIADAAICCGIGLIALQMYRDRF